MSVLHPDNSWQVKVFERCGNSSWIWFGQDLMGIDGESTVSIVLSDNEAMCAVGESSAYKYKGKISVFTYDLMNMKWKPKGEDILGQSEGDAIMHSFGQSYFMHAVMLDINVDDTILAMGSPGNSS